jgi:hypothetical protein
MSPQIDVDTEVLAELGRQARPFIDKEPNHVIRRLLGLDDVPTPKGFEVLAEAKSTAKGPGLNEFQKDIVDRVIAKRTRQPKNTKPTRTRARKGSVLEEEAYFIPILRALTEQDDGRLAASEVIDRVGELIDDQLKPADREMLETGTVRWKARTQFARMHMKEQGLLKPDSPRGIWEISDAGRQHLQASGVLNAG